MSKKTICILLPNHWDDIKGGAEYQVLCLADRLREITDFRIVYLARHVPDDREGYWYELRGFRGPSLLGGLRWGRWVDSIDLYRQLKEISPDVIVHMVASAYTGVAAFYARRFGSRLLWYLASDRDVDSKPVLGVGRLATLFDMPLFRYGASRAHYIVAQTRKQAEVMKDTLGREADLVVGNFHPLPNKACEKADKFTVLWVANMKPLKRPELFVRLAEELCLEGEWSFKMIGRNDSSAEGMALLEHASSIAGFEYLGELEVDEVNEHMESAHVFVNTSEYEGFPNTFIQAWMRKVPTLSICVDPDGIINRNGLGHCSGSYEALKDQLVCYYDDRDLLETCAARCAGFAEENFGMANADRVIELIRKAAG